MKTCAYEVATPLTYIFNRPTSFKNGYFPKDLKLKAKLNK